MERYIDLSGEKSKNKIYVVCRNKPEAFHSNKGG